MNIEKLKEAIEATDLPQRENNFLSGFIERANEEERLKSEDRLLIEQVASEKKLSEIILSTDEVKIYTVSGKDEWDIKYPYRSIFVNAKGVWERSNTVSPSLDLAYLVYLEKRHLGSNSQFVSFALKMLEIRLED